MGLPLGAFIGAIVIVMVAITAIASLMIADHFTLQAVEELSLSHARQMVVTVKNAMQDQIKGPQLAVNTMQAEILRQNYSLPNETSGDWWATPMNLVQAATAYGEYSYGQVLLFFSDGGICRSLTLNDHDGKRLNLYCSRPNASNPRNKFIVEQKQRQFYLNNMTEAALSDHLPVPYSPSLSIYFSSMKNVQRLTNNTRGAYYWSKPLYGNFPTAILITVFGILHDNNGRWLGQAGAIITASAMQDVLKAIELSPGTVSFLSENDGTLLAASGDGMPSASWTSGTAGAWNTTTQGELPVGKCFETRWRFIPVPPGWACRENVSSYPFYPLNSLAENAAFVNPTGAYVTETKWNGNLWYAVSNIAEALQSVNIHVGEADNTDYSQLKYVVYLFLRQDTITSDIDKGRTLAIWIVVIIAIVGSALTVLIVQLLLAPLRGLVSDLESAARLNFHEEGKDGAGNTKSTSVISEVQAIRDTTNVMINNLKDAKKFMPSNVFASNQSDEGNHSTNELSFSTATDGLDFNPLKLIEDQSSTVAESDMGDEPEDKLDVPAEQEQESASSVIELDMDGLDTALAPRLMDSSKSAYRKVTTVLLVFSDLKSNAKGFHHHTAMVFGEVAGAALRYGGVMETMTSRSIRVSFGAHHNVPRHELQAIKFASHLEKTIDPTVAVRMTVDTSGCRIGVIEAGPKSFRAVDGESFTVTQALVPVASDYLGVRTIITERTKRGANFGKNSNINLALIDRVKVRCLEKELYIFTLESEAFDHAFATTYSKALASLCVADTPRAQDILTEMKNSKSSTLHLERLRAAIKHTLELENDQTYVRPERSSFYPCGAALLEGADAQEDEHLAATPSAKDIHAMKNAIVAAAAPAEIPEEEESPAGFLMMAPAAGGEEDLPLVLKDQSDSSWKRAQRPIAKGAFGEVYSAIGSNGSIIAVKSLNLDQRNIDVSSLSEELTTTSQLRHSNIVSYLSWAVVANHVCIFMEWMPGGSLHHVLETYGKIEEDVLRRFILDSLDGLAHMHKEGLVHCDVKPRNLLLGVDGTVKIADFGSAVSGRSVAGGEGDALSMHGTTWYVAPEVAAGGAPTPASDMWSLGITVLELLTGGIPWTVEQRCGNNEYRFLQRLSQRDPSFRPPIDASALSPQMHNLIESCLETDPAKRPTAFRVLNGDFSLSA